MSDRGQALQTAAGGERRCWVDASYLPWARDPASPRLAGEVGAGKIKRQRLVVLVHFWRNAMALSLVHKKARCTLAVLHRLRVSFFGCASCGPLGVCVPADLVRAPQPRHNCSHADCRHSWKTSVSCCRLCAETWCSPSLED